MKKNLLSIVILALLLVNTVLTAIIMFSTVSANKKTAQLVGDIASVLDLELSNPNGIVTPGQGAVSIADTAVYNINDAMTIALRPSADGKEHYAMCEMSFSLNTTHDDYATYAPMMESQESKIRSIIIGVIGGYTKEDAVANQKAIEAEILSQVQQMFNSDFVFEAYFRDIKFQ